MPATYFTPNEREFYRKECVDNENGAAENWKLKYGDKLRQYDTLYKYVPGMMRCITGMDTDTGMKYVQSGTIPLAPERPKTGNYKDPEVVGRLQVPRPLTAKPKVGYGGLGCLADDLDPARLADTVYERDFCIKDKPFPAHIRGINMTKTSHINPWKAPAEGTFAVIPTRWQFPPGVPGIPAVLERSELRRLRLAKEAKEKKEQERLLHSGSSVQGGAVGPKQSQLNLAIMERPRSLNMNPAVQRSKQAAVPKQGQRSKGAAPAREFARESWPTQSRSWAPVCNPAPKGWYKDELAAAKLKELPDRNSVLNTPQARLNVLKRRIDNRATVLADA